MTWRIVSPRVGTPGALFVPKAGVNVEALERGGFIVRVEDDKDTAKTPPTRKVAPSKKERPNNG